VPSQNRTRTIDRTAARERRAARVAQTEGKTNRAQLQAMEIREAETRAGTAEVITNPDVSDGFVAGAIAASRRPMATAKRAIARPIVLTKEQEYRFIRADLRRLATTAGALFVVMIVLLFVVD
jgi:hypothetical protein